VRWGCDGRTSPHARELSGGSVDRGPRQRQPVRCCRCRRSAAVEDLLLHLLRLRGRFEPEILVQDPPELVVYDQRLAPPAAAMQRLHKPNVERFVQPVVGDQAAQLTDDLAWPVVGQVGLDPCGYRFQSLFLQVHRQAVQAGAHADIHQCGAAPERQRLAEQLRSVAVVAEPQRGHAPLHGLFELEDVHVFARHGQQIPAGAGGQQARALGRPGCFPEQLAQLVDVGLHDGLDGAGRVGRP
jgi:hypothetical protein